MLLGGASFLSSAGQSCYGSILKLSIRFDSIVSHPYRVDSAANRYHPRVPTTPESSDSKDSLVRMISDHCMPYRSKIPHYRNSQPAHILNLSLLSRLSDSSPITHSISQTEPLQVPAISNFVPVQPSLHKDKWLKQYLSHNPSRYRKVNWDWLHLPKLYCLKIIPIQSMRILKSPSC